MQHICSAASYQLIKILLACHLYNKPIKQRLYKCLFPVFHQCIAHMTGLSIDNFYRFLDLWHFFVVASFTHVNIRKFYLCLRSFAAFDCNLLFFGFVFFSLIYLFDDFCFSALFSLDENIVDFYAFFQQLFNQYL